MQAGQLISKEFLALSPSDTVQKAIERLHEYKLLQLPVVNHSQLLGLVCEEDLLEIKTPIAAIESVKLPLMNTFVYENAHIFEVMKHISHEKISVLPVLNLQKEYVGLITEQQIIHYLSSTLSLTQNGAILVLQMSNIDHSMAQMAQIVESNHALILASYVTTSEFSTKIEVTLKLNKVEVSAIKADFERYNYQVVEVYNQVDDFENMQERYDALMNYLNA